MGSTQSSDQPLVCVQGLGFVGAAMAIACALAKRADGRPAFRVVGVDLPNDQGRARIDALNRGRFPFETVDSDLPLALERIRQQGNLEATSDEDIYRRADVVVVDLPLDLLSTEPGHSVRSVAWRPFRAAMRVLGETMPAGSLVVVETTVPPGTCERVVAPEIAASLRGRGLPEDAIAIAHSYERIMPGSDYLRSVTDFWRVYAGLTPEAADRCGAFLETVINVRDFPLTRLASTTASETAKVLENSFRAVNIAFVEEWRQFAEVAGIDLFDVVDAIRVRPTHANLRQPGLGVGGYCLPKDPLFGEIAARELFDTNLRFPFSTQAVETNRNMPLSTVQRLSRLLGGLGGRRLLILGASYRPGVGDLRQTPARTLVREARALGANLVVHDPLAASEAGFEIASDLPAADGFDAVIFTVAHDAYRELDLESWMKTSRPLIFDANGVLTQKQQQVLEQRGHAWTGAGRG